LQQIRLFLLHRIGLANRAAAYTIGLFDYMLAT